MESFGKRKNQFFIISLVLVLCLSILLVDPVSADKKESKGIFDDVFTFFQDITGGITGFVTSQSSDDEYELNATDTNDDVDDSYEADCGATEDEIKDQLPDQITIGAEPVDKEYNLTIEVDEVDTGYGSCGSTTPSAGTYTYDSGEIVDISATSDDNCTFNEWTGDTGQIDDPSSSDTTINMTGNFSITAVFEEE